MGNRVGAEVGLVVTGMSVGDSVGLLVLAGEDVGVSVGEFVGN